MIAGIYEPIVGRRSVEGRFTLLFDMMPGLDVEDSGYENIFTSGLLLGMSRNFIESRFLRLRSFPSSANIYPCQCAPIPPA